MLFTFYKFSHIMKTMGKAKKRILHKSNSSLFMTRETAVSKVFTMLSKEQEASVVSVVEKELYVGVGLRSLSAGHPDYHGIYCGSLPKRDAAYHQGTAWGFLLGGFISAYVKVHGRTEESIQAAKELLNPIYLHLFNGGCIGSVSEIFDGDTPHHPRGCYAQAWSVGEVLRCYAQDILDR